jgi:hypothetical protein
MQIGDLVRIKEEKPIIWKEAQGQIGLVVAVTKRLFIPAAKVMVLGEVAEFDVDELELINASR